MLGNKTKKFSHFHPPVSEASREVANLIGRKNPHTPVFYLSIWIESKPLISSDFTNQARTTFKKTLMLRQDSKTQPFMSSEVQKNP